MYRMILSQQQGRFLVNNTLLKPTMILFFLVATSFAKSTIAVKAIKSELLSEVEGESLTNFITSKLAEVSKDDKVMAWSDVAEMLKQLGESSELSALANDASAVECMSDKCFEELGGALGVDKILVTDLSNLGNSMIVNMRVIDLIRAESKARSSLRVQNGLDGILDGMPKLLLGLGYGAVMDPEIQKQHQAEENQKLEQQQLANQEAEQKKQAEEQEEADKARQNELVKHEQEKDRLRKQEAAKEAARLATMDKEDPNRNARKWLRYAGYGFTAIGGGLAYVGKSSVDNAHINSLGALESNNESAYQSAVKESETGKTQRTAGLGLLGLGLVGVGISFTF
jgi:hypothetical protein